MDVPQLVMVGTFGPFAASYLTKRQWSPAPMVNAKRVGTDWMTKLHLPGYRQIYLDAPRNTLYRDDTQGGANLKGIYQYTQSQFRKEADCHPGVQLMF